MTEQLRRELVHLQLEYRQKEAQVLHLTDQLERVGRRFAEKRKHTHEKMFSFG